MRLYCIQIILLILGCIGGYGERSFNCSSLLDTKTLSPIIYKFLTIKDKSERKKVGDRIYDIVYKACGDNPTTCGTFNLIVINKEKSYALSWTRPKSQWHNVLMIKEIK